MADEVATPLIKAPVSQRLSAIWLVPAIALIFSLWLVIQHYSSLGPLITITFENAEGIEAGLTPVRMRNVEVGTVKEIRLDEQLERVVISVRMNNGADNFLNQYSRFWIVRPRVDSAGVSGLNTLLSGGYITMETRTGGDFQDEFIGLEEPPLTPDDTPGLHLQLIATEGAAINVGAPVLHRQTEVGKVEGRELRTDGQGVIFQIFIQAPYDVLVNSNTKFWENSTFDIRMDANGLSVDADPLGVLISGGIAFDTPRQLQEGKQVQNHDLFTLYSSAESVQSVPTPSADALGFVLYFDESIRGLEVGAPVEYRGIRIGHVADIRIQRDTGNNGFAIPILIFIEPQRFGLEQVEDIHEIIDDAIAKGLRAQLNSDNLLLGSLYVDLSETDSDDTAQINPGLPYPEFPTTPSNINQLTAKASAVIDKLAEVDLKGLLTSTNQLIIDLDALLRTPSDEELGETATVKREQLTSAPVQQLLGKINLALDGLNPILHDEGTKTLPANLTASIAQLNSTMVSVKRILSGDTQHSPLYYELSSTLRELTKAARAVRTLTQSLEEKPNAVFFGND